MKNPWKTLSSKIVFENPYYQIRRDKVTRPNGEKGTYDVLETPGAVFIIALDDDGKFPLIGQFRYPTGTYSLETPAGGCEKNSRDPLVDAKRELQEETGLVAREWSEVGRCYSFNGLSNEEMVTYIARDLKQTPETGHQEEGILEVKKVTFEEAFAMIRSREINDSQCISAILQAAMYMGKIKVN
jgi:8-oxo-dGTP pyrophosphatase MutT (NUDIX family)